MAVDLVAVVGTSRVFTDDRLRVERDWEHHYNFPSNGQERGWGGDKDLKNVTGPYKVRMC